MTLGKLITRLLRPCSSAPKSPTPPNSPNKGDESGSAVVPGKEGESQSPITEVTPCQDISNMPDSPVNTSDKATPQKPALTISTSARKEPVKKLEKQDTKVPIAEVPKSSPQGKPQAVQVTEAATDEAEQVVLEVFGFDVLHQLQGKTWDERGQAVQAARARVAQGNMGVHPLENFFHASCCIARVGLKDKVMPVFFDGLDLAKLLLGDFASKQDIDKELLTKEVDAIMPIIVGKTSDRNARSIEGTRQALVFLARQPTVGCQPVMAHILNPITNAKEVAAIRGRLELISHVIDEFGFSKSSGLALSAVMGFVRPHLDATDEKVRRAAVEVTVSCYSLKGERTLKYCSNLKPALMKLLEQRFAEVDSTKNGGKKGSPLPEVRASKAKKGGRQNASSGSSRQSSSSGSVVGRPKPFSFGERVESRESNNQRTPHSHDAILEDEAMLHADLFANSNDPLSPVLQSPAHSNVFASPDVRSSPSHSHFGMASETIGQSPLSRNDNPNYIPSPTNPTDDPFSIDDEAFMNEIEDL